MRPSGKSTAQPHPNIQRVKSAEYVNHSVDPMYGTFLSLTTEEDVERIKKEAERLNNDPEARRELFIRIGFYDKDGNVAERFRDL